jgi:hypothetical protein
LQKAKGEVMRCTGCGGENEQDHHFCVHCGISLQTAHSAPRFQREPTAIIQKPTHDEQQKITIISIAAIIASFIVVFILTGINPKTIPALLLLFFPLILGELIFLLKARKPVLMIEKFQTWLKGKKETNTHRAGFVSKWFLEPLLLCLAKTMQVAEGIENPHFRAGVITSALLYAIGFIVCVAVGIVVAIVSH